MWTGATSPPALDADGSVIVAVSHEGLIYTSTDTGSTFSQADVAEDDFVSVKCSR
jgi:hypothetical protein